MKKLFSIFCCLLLSASMVTQAQESPIRDADVSATSSQIIADETELLDDGIYVGDVTGPRKAPAATAYAMMKNSTVQYAEIMKLSTTNCYKIIIKVANNYGGAVKTGFVVTSFNTGSNTKIGGNHQFSSTYSNCSESDNWFVQNYSSSSNALYVDNPYGYIQFTYQSMGADGYPIYRIYIHDCYGYTYNNGCINWKSSGAIFSWDNNVSVHPMDANKDRIDFTDYYTISVSSNNNSYGTVSGGGTYAAGAARTLTASVASSSYQFLGWKKNGGSSYVSTSASYNVTVNGNDSYVAEFAPKSAPQYTITTAVSPSNTYGTVTGAGSYYENNPATLTATSANEHLYIFDHWLKDGNNYAGGTTITPTVTANATYTAVFRNAAEGTITGVANYGTISGTGHYTGGSAVTLTVTPNSGYKFAQWSDGNEDNPRTVYVDGDATYTAQFTDLNQPLLASFSWETDNISIETYGDGDGLCNSFYSPASKQFHLLYAKANNRSTKNYLNLSIQSSQTYMWGDVSFFKPGSYPVVSSGYTTGFCGNNGPYWYWTLDQTDVCVAYGYDSYNLGLNQLGSYLCDKSGNADDDSDQSNYISVGEGITCIIEVGANGDPYVRLVRNTDQQCLVSVGDPASTHALAWDANGGELSGTYTAAGDYEEGAAITAPTATKTGYHLTGWSPAFTGTMPAANTTYVAQWELNTYTVTFKVHDNSTGFGTLQKNSETPTTEIVFTGVDHGTAKPGSAGGNALSFQGSTITPIPAEAAGGYTYAFQGWNGATSKITSDKTISARFTRTATVYSITYNNYDISTYPGTVTTSYTVETPAITLLFAPNVAKEGYTFDGWYANEELTGNPVTTIPAGSTGNKEFWAKWTPIDYEITFHANGGSGSFMNLTYTIEDDAIDLWTDEDIEKANCTFNGWYDNEGLTGDPVTSIPAGSTGNKEFWAKWTENITTYSVQFHEGEHGRSVTATAGGNSISNGANVQEGTSVTLTAEAKNFYHFREWQDSNNGTQVSTANPYTVNNLAGNLNLTAVFERDEVIVLEDTYKKSDNVWYEDYAELVSDVTTSGDKVTVRYERTMNANTWLVFSLPFSYSTLKAGSTFNGSVYKLDRMEYNTDGYMTLNFLPVTIIEENRPYLFYSSSAAANPTFADVELKDIDNGSYDTENSGNAGGKIWFRNTQARTQLDAERTDDAKKKVIYLNANKLYYLSLTKETWMRAFRGYFELDETTVYYLQPRVRIVLEGQTATEVETAGQEDNSSVRKYMENGILVIEREGVRYDATGAKIN